MSRFEYIRLADAVAADIAGGALKPGDRLPPQRTFAFERKIAASTASRVYTELLRRGLVVGLLSASSATGQPPPAIGVGGEVGPGRWRGPPGRRSKWPRAART